ncbi:N-acetylglucosamine kinase [Paenibacillus sp. 1001270B_150601_E10]|uniref:N-acetylglucosamine kinase n=1 Tax=Paenibacillus sp. 1001270B_150601_E10 TaxID=2787079 RepID=UPI00189F7C6F|nr:BadF/BadG/BcrA/BcrD ATPase family protein [Paenibacillus sp. 1001270B_150601_E10]
MKHMHIAFTHQDSKRIVIGIDGGGTHTRAIAARMDGTIIGDVQTGCCNPNKDERAEEHVKDAIVSVLERADAVAEDVAGLCAGLAGIETEEDLSWAESFTSVPGIACPKKLVNDSYVAHAGAFLGEAGIMAISGTGSVVFGLNEQGRLLRNQDFHHYAGAARHLAFDCVYRILAGYAGEEDQGLVTEVLHYWKVDSVAQLYEQGMEGFALGVHEQMRMFGKMGPIVTRAAKEGSPLAMHVCTQLADALDIGVRLIGAGFAEEQVQVAFMGSVIQDDYIAGLLTERLIRHIPGSKQYQVVQPCLSPTIGAVWLALKECGASIDASVMNHLEQGC